jgi:hypothetical protein
MANDPTWTPRAAPKAAAKGASCVGYMVFVAGMGAAFWIGTMWASQTWLSFTQ